MAIDFEREEQPENGHHGEHATEKSRQQPKRQLPISGLLTAADAVEYQADEAQAGVSPTVGQAAREGFTGGFSNELSAGATMGALLQVAESAEEGLSMSDREARMKRFPELRGVELPTGAAARFPELAEQPRQTRQVEEDELYSR